MNECRVCANMESMVYYIRSVFHDYFPVLFYDFKVSDYLTRAVYSPASDPVKAVPGSWVPGFPDSWACPGMYAESNEC